MNVFDKDFDVAAALKNDQDGQNLRAVRDALSFVQARLRREMDKGLPQKDFVVVSDLHKACIAGQDLVEQFWSQPRK
jgi:hypothetical protein